MGLKFVKKRPVVSGEYLYKYHNNFSTELGKVAKGDWRKAQNPKLWYFNYPGGFKELRSMNGYFSEIIPEIIVEN